MKQTIKLKESQLKDIIKEELTRGDIALFGDIVNSLAKNNKEFRQNLEYYSQFLRGHQQLNQQTQQLIQNRQQPQTQHPQFQQQTQQGNIVNESQLRQIIRESIMNVLSEVANPMKR